MSYHSSSGSSSSSSSSGTSSSSSYSPSPSFSTSGSTYLYDRDIQNVNKKYSLGSEFYIYGTDTSKSSSAGYYYPLFISESDAKSYDLTNGGTGVSHTHTFTEYPDKTFYMPNVSMNHAVAAVTTDIRKYAEDIQTEKLSALVESQFPNFYKEEGTNFISFMQAYYEYMELNGKMNDAIRNLSNYNDITTTTQDFLDYFIGTFLPGVPFEVSANKKLMVKYVKYFNETRGTLNAYKLLFRSLYNENMEVDFPGKRILKVSDGDWITTKYLVCPYNVEVYDFIGRTIIGTQSKSQALCEDIIRKVVKGRDLLQILVSNVKGTFEHGEKIKLSTDTLTTGTVSVIECGINSIEILSAGAEYLPGDVLELQSDISGDFGKVVVMNTVDNGGGIIFQLTDGGSGYTSTSVGTVVKVEGGGNFTTKASFQIDSSNITDTFAIALNTDLFGTPTIYAGSSSDENKKRSATVEV